MEKIKNEQSKIYYKVPEKTEFNNIKVKNEVFDSIEIQIAKKHGLATSRNSIDGKI